MAGRVVVSAYANYDMLTWREMARLGEIYVIGYPFSPYDFICGYDDSGNLLFKINSGTATGNNLPPSQALFIPDAFTMDAAGRLYVAGKAWTRYFYSNGVVTSQPERTGLRIYTAVGDYVSEVLQTNATAIWSSIAVSEDGTRILVTGSADSSGNTTHLYDENLELLWSVNNGNSDASGGNTSALFDNDGNIITSSVSDLVANVSGRISKYSASGVLLWTFYTKSVVVGMDIDASNFIYVSAEAVNSINPSLPLSNLLKISSAGALIAETPLLRLYYGVYIYATGTVRVIGSDVYVFCSYYYGPQNYPYGGPYYNMPGYFRYDLALSEIESGAAHPVTRVVWKGPPVRILSGGRFYTLAGNAVTVYGSPAAASSALWTRDASLDDQEGFALMVRDVETPPLRLLYYLAKPATQGDLYTLLYAGLGVSLAVKLPRGLLDFSGQVPPQTVYRLTLTGSTPLILPMSSFQCRRTSNSTSVSAVCPSLTVSRLAAINERLSGDLVIDRGLRFPDGIIQWAELLRAPLMTVRSDSGAHHSSATLEGEAVDMTANPQTRRVMGLSYDSTTNGRRHVRCAVDTYLLPGDWADLGSGDSLLVGELTYAVSPTQEMMDLMEARSA